MRTFFRPVKVYWGKVTRGFSGEMILAASIKRIVGIGEFVIGKLVEELVLVAKAE